MASPWKIAYAPGPVMRFSRKITMAMLFPAIIFTSICAAQGYSFILLSLIGTGYSFALGALLFLLERSKKDVPVALVAALDLAAAAIYLGLLIPVWVGGRNWADNIYWWHADWPRVMSDFRRVIFIIYTTFFFLANMIIHVSMGARNLLNAFPLPVRRTCERCGHCTCGSERTTAEFHGRPGARTKTVDSGAAYSLLGDNSPEETPRPSAEVV